MQGFHTQQVIAHVNGSDYRVGTPNNSAAAKGGDRNSGLAGPSRFLPYIDHCADVNNNPDAGRNVGLAVYMDPRCGRPIVETTNGGGPWADYFYNNYLTSGKQADKADTAPHQNDHDGITDGTFEHHLRGKWHIRNTQYKVRQRPRSRATSQGGTFGTARAGKAGDSDPAASRSSAISMKRPASAAGADRCPKAR